MKRPQVHVWAFVFFSAGVIPLILICAWAIRDGWFPTERILEKHPDPSDNFYAFNYWLAIITGGLIPLMLTPIWIMAFAKRRPWAWTTTLIFIALGIMGNPVCFIPLLVFWVKDDNKAYYGKIGFSSQVTLRDDPRRLS